MISVFILKKWIKKRQQNKELLFTSEQPVFFSFLFLLLLQLGPNGSLTAQNFHLLDIPVYEDGAQLANPWVGGMNAPQWSSFDMNRDGVKDLYAFDRNGHVHLAFINQNNMAGATAYKYSRHWLYNFPDGQHYVLMRDYNRDGAADMFVSSFDEGFAAFKVYKGGFDQNNLLAFDRVEFPEYMEDIIPYQLNGNIESHITIFNNAEYPAIDDIDGDGDLDILTMNDSGNKVLFYKNIALESGYNDEVLMYELVDDCWGRFGITPFTPKFTLSSDASMCAFFKEPISDENRLHGGATLCTFDNDNDGDKELLYGDLIFPNIVFGKNGGNKDNAFITEQDTIFPSFDVPVHIENFPASFYMDVDNDGARDLLFCPNSPENSPDVETVRWYKNNGTDELPEFQFQQNDFLVDGILDFGTGANPIFEDINADGLLDIVIGNRIEWSTDNFGTGKSYLVLLINIGSADEPEFEVFNKDWLNLSQHNPDIRSMSPAFGDLDGDGDRDMFFGDRQGFVHYLENIAGANMPMQFDTLDKQWKDINVGAYSTPFIFDVNKDGLLDLIIGERAGNINYFPNIGSTTNPAFHPNESELPNNEFFGKISTINGGSVGFSQPTIVDYNGELNIFSGTDRGWLVQYKINPDSLSSGAFELLNDELGNLREGFITRAFFANINSSDYLDVIVGNDRGGVSIFQSPITVDGLVDNKNIYAEKEAVINLFPNPSDNYIYVEANNDIFKKWF